MNQMGQERCMELEEHFRHASQEELHKRLIRRRNMSMVCHCSAEIDQSTLLYFSVNDMYLGSGDFIMLLLAETSSSSKEQEEGMDVFGRSYTYTLIQEEATALLGGHFTTYPCELDGRLVILIQFHYGILPAQREGLLGMIAEHCQSVAIACREKYDLHVCSYISEVITEIPLLSSVYHKMLSVVTLHQFMQRFPEDNIYLLGHPDPNAPGPADIDLDEDAKAIANAVIARQDPHPALNHAMDMLHRTPFMSTDELRIRYGSLFEKLSSSLRLRGIRYNEELFRAEMIASVMNATHFEECEAWMEHYVMHMYSISENENQTLATSRFKEAQKYIEEHIYNPMLSVQEIASVTKMSPPSVINMFRKNLNITPAKYIRDLRLQKAVELLQNPDLSIQQVCEDCGFGSIETFHRVFKAEYGVTPGQFRHC